MARGSSFGGLILVILFVVIGLPILLLFRLIDSFGPLALLFGAAGVIGLLAAYGLKRQSVRLAELTCKYSSESIAQRIMQRKIWEGQTSEQLRDSRGQPLATDDVLLKTRKREIWKYERRGKNRFGLRVTLDNDVVTGWAQRQE
jgi:hypothetical protein